MVDLPPPAETLRPATPDDVPFLMAVYAGTRAAELSLTDWSDEQKAAFCRSQFEAQDYHYRKYYPTAEFSVIERDGIPVGRLYLDRWEREIRIMDIALLPEHTGRGIGTRLIRILQEEAAATGKCLGIHVEKFNPALRLYDRLGFRVAEDKDIHFRMEWNPGTVS